MNDYIKDYLRPILGGDVSEDIVEYILTMKHLEDYEEFMENIVDLNNPEHVRIYEALKDQLFGAAMKTPKSQKQNRNASEPFQILNNSKQMEPSPSTPHSSGKKKKYHNFYTHNHKPGLLKGRHPCNCQAMKHNLVNNCTKCGRIVCEQEGSGPCFFCDNMVCTRYEMEVLNSNTKESDKLYNQLLEQKKSKEWKKAIETRNRLIKTDQMGDLIKNKVYDDQNDYFELSSNWLTEDEKSNVKKNYPTVHKSRQNMKLALNFASRTVTIDDDHQKHKKNLMIGVNKLLDTTETRFPRNLFEGDKGKLITDIIKLMDEQQLSSDKDETPNEVPPVSKISKFKFANSDFQEAVDQGMCLSMHQPWASLLIAGIKTHEGRTWKTDHRGRLWIAAAAKQPEDDEILTCEHMYRNLYNDPTLEFPKKYPTSCLLGCVFVEDCLNQREYRQKYPDGESNSPYVLICSNPVILPVFYPMQGQHKIFSLPKELHRTAKIALMSSKWV